MAGGELAIVKATPKKRAKVTKPTPMPARKSQRVKIEEVAPAANPDEPVEETSEEDEGETPGPKRIVTEVTLDKSFMEKHLLSEVVECLRAQSWDHLFQEEVFVNEDMVRTFYQNLEVEEKKGMLVGTLVLNDDVHTITPKLIAAILKVPLEGFSEYVKGIWPPTMAKAEIILKVGEDESNTSKQGNALKMGILNRTLHRLAYSSLTPRMQKHGVISLLDYVVIYKLLVKEQVSLPHLILQHMQYCIGAKNHALPYPGLVKKIMLHFDVYSDENETLLSSPLNMEAYEKLGWRYEATDGWANTRYGIPAAPMADASVEETPDVPESSSKPEDMHAVLVRLMSLEEKVDRLLTLGDYLRQGREIQWDEVVKGHTAVLELIPSMLRDIEGSVGEVKEKVSALANDLKFVTTMCLERFKSGDEKTDASGSRG